MEAKPLTKTAFAPYGDVISVDDSNVFTMANQGTAQRYNHLTTLANLRDSSEADAPAARPNVCIFRSFPKHERPVNIRLLERHKHSTQMFIPMTNSSSNSAQCYLLIVATNDPITDKPDGELCKLLLPRRRRRSIIVLVSGITP
ncbi:ureidoglycolate hydrolase-domain-containing protein [Chytridium lagenaria]|nr:ureidoglycolate hydrolase-domain-containing protein [Chytridium lagenaria]